MALTEIILIRHGETAWNKESRIQGQRDTPLSPLGEEQSALLGARLRGEELAHAYASDSIRASRTAQVALAGREVALTVSPAWRERAFGSWEGLLWEEVRRRFPEDARRFEADSVGFSPAGGESWNQLQDRVFDELKVVAARHSGQKVAVFSHGGPCKAAIFAALGLPPQGWRQWVTANASIQRLLWDPQRNAWKLAGFNDTAHLRKTAPADTLTLAE